MAGILIKLTTANPLLKSGVIRKVTCAHAVQSVMDSSHISKQQRPCVSCKALIFNVYYFVGVTGFEPVTPCSQSTTICFSPCFIHYHFFLYSLIFRH